ncbi:GPN-loop GTPase 3-like [Asparagus officinalis]|uniref:GPN-loop GTPase 3-like n=1 Tax=Asparagus officinalis TaxID=4686 RepID=UPI00098E72FB|nr:GPN-loop GTPase 3-like [Asparagus officinalis]
MASLSAMIQLELPRVNTLSKIDIVTNKKDIEDFLNPEAPILLSQLNQNIPVPFAKLNKALTDLVGQFNMVNFEPLDLRKERRNSAHSYR